MHNSRSDVLQEFLQAFADVEGPGNFDITEDWIRNHIEKIDAVLSLTSEDLNKNEKLEHLAIEFLSYVVSASTEEKVKERIMVFLELRVSDTFDENNRAHAKILLFEGFRDLEVCESIVQMLADSGHPGHYPALSAVVTSIRNGEHVFQARIKSAIEFRKFHLEALRNFVCSLL